MCNSKQRLGSSARGRIQLRQKTRLLFKVIHSVIQRRTIEFSFLLTGNQFCVKRLCQGQLLWFLWSFAGCTILAKLHLRGKQLIG